MGNTIISEEDILNILKKESDALSDTDLKWKLFHYCRDNGLQGIGNQQYVKADAVYDYKLGNEAEAICCSLKSEYPEIKVAVWETRVLNEWLNLLIAKNTIFIETEKAFLETIYDALTEANDNRLILLNPKIDEYYRYQKDGLVILKTMVERAPVSKNSHVTIEKIFVDLLCDKILTEIFDSYSVRNMLQEMKKRYAFNEKRLLAYARRRGRYEEIGEFWRGLND